MWRVEICEECDLAEVRPLSATAPPSLDLGVHVRIGCEDYVIEPRNEFVC